MARPARRMTSSSPIGPNHSDWRRTSVVSRSRTLKTWAKELGLNEAVNLLEETLQEEKKTDEALTELAESAVNQEAQQAAE